MSGPPARDFRIAELDEWFRFLRAEANVLQEAPELLRQRAAQRPGSTPGRRAMEQLRAGSRPWLRRLNPTEAGSPCRLTLTGHNDSVVSCGFSPDGTRLASIALHGKIKLWKVRDGSELPLAHPTPPARDQLRRIGYVAQGRRLLVQDVGFAAELRDAETGEVVAELRQHAEWVVDTAVSPDGNRVLTAARDGGLRLWDAAFGELLTAIQATEDREEWLVVCRFLPDGKRAVAGSRAGALGLWDLASGRQLARFGGVRRRAAGCAVSPDGLWVAVATEEEGALRIWPVARPDQPRLLEPGAGMLGYPHLCFSPDGSRLLAHRGMGAMVRVWDVASGSLRGELPIEPLSHVAGLSPSGDRILAGCWDGSILLWDADTLEPAGTLRGHGGPIVSLAWSSDGKILATSSADGTLKLWSPGDAEPEAEGDEAPPAGIAAGAVARGGELAVGSTERGLLLLDSRSGRTLQTLAAADRKMTVCRFSPAGDLLAAGGSGGALSVWRLPGALSVEPGERHEKDVNGLAFSPDGRLLASASMDGTVALLDTKSLRRRLTLQAHPGPRGVLDCAFFPDGARLVSAGADGRVVVWDVASGRELASFKDGGREQRVCIVAPDGRRVLAASDPYVEGYGWGRLLLWDSAGGDPRCLAQLGPGMVACGFSPGGARVLGCGSRCDAPYDGEYFASRKAVSVWDAASGERLLSIRLRADAAAAVYSPSGRWILLVDGEGRVQIHDAETGALRWQERVGGAATVLAWTPDEQRVIVGGFATPLQLFQLE